ncbi:hypothetical protein [Indioceanicola profundi]|uniref:hypothetical protein n=1 Tax=Indioceanicola profundi TaxID=2220096 RepID=UPI000E6A961A|nr:hypothetical protein [Indioceanicola profundi]
MFMPDTTRLIAAGTVLVAVAIASTSVRADSVAFTGADLVVHRVAGISPAESGVCTADLTIAAPKGKTLLVEAVRGHGFSRAEVKGELPRFVMTSTSSGHSTNHALTVGYVNAARRYFSAELSRPVTVSPGAVLTAVVELPAGNAAPMTCRFQIEGRLVDTLAGS